MSLRTRRQELRRAKGHSPTKHKPYDKDDTTAGRRRKKSHHSENPPVFSCESTPPLSQDLGMPSRAQYQRIEKAYMTSLHARKQEKALLSQDLFDKIWDVLHDPGSARVGTPQFRWWVRKMFVLSHPPATFSSDDLANLGAEKMMPVVLHENRPVAIKDQIYDVLCYCHQVANHGGRDKTTAVIRDHYSWIPKELIAQFVKACPTCVFKKTGNITLAMSMNPEGESSHPTIDTDNGTVGDSDFDALHVPELGLPVVDHCVPLPVSNVMGFEDRPRSCSPMLKLWMPTPGPAPSSMSHPMPALTWSDSSYDTHSTCWSIPSYTSTLVSDVRSQPGSSKTTLDAPSMQRFSSAEERITLPPLMKTLAEGMLGMHTPLMRPHLDAPDSFGLPPAPEQWYHLRQDQYAHDAWTPAHVPQQRFSPQIDPTLLQDEPQQHWMDHNPLYTAVQGDPTVPPFPVSTIVEDEDGAPPQEWEVAPPTFVRGGAGQSFLLPLSTSPQLGTTSGLRDPRRSVENLVEPFCMDPTEVAGEVQVPLDFQTHLRPLPSLDDIAHDSC
ncbi:hypothetical protein B0H21DRAFT_510624 [Amylocystis lapponica]|nr:hypothetical protein B0H21DRAFT_510624 [Amylocystis lapponica]